MAFRKSSLTFYRLAGSPFDAQVRYFGIGTKKRKIRSEKLQRVQEKLNCPTTRPGGGGLSVVSKFLWGGGGGGQAIGGTQVPYIPTLGGRKSVENEGTDRKLYQIGPFFTTWVENLK